MDTDSKKGYIKKQKNQNSQHNPKEVVVSWRIDSSWFHSFHERHSNTDSVILAISDKINESNKHIE